MKYAKIKAESMILELSSVIIVLIHSIYVLPDLYIIHILWYIRLQEVQITESNRELQIHSYILFKFSSEYEYNEF